MGISTSELRRKSRDSRDSGVSNMTRSSPSSAGPTQESTQGSQKRTCSSCGTLNVFTPEINLRRGYVCYSCYSKEVPEGQPRSAETKSSRRQHERSFEKAFQAAVEEVAIGIAAAKADARRCWHHLQREVELQCALCETISCAGGKEFSSLLRDCSLGDDVAQFEMVLDQMKAAGIEVVDILTEAVKALNKSDDTIALWSYLKTALEDEDRMSIETFAEALPPEKVRYTEVFLKRCEVREVKILRHLEFNNKVAEASRTKNVESLLNLAEEAKKEGFDASGPELAVAFILGSSEATRPTVQPRKYSARENSPRSSPPTFRESQPPPTFERPKPPTGWEKPEERSERSEKPEEKSEKSKTPPEAEAQERGKKQAEEPKFQPDPDDSRTKAPPRPSWAGRGPTRAQSSEKIPESGYRKRETSRNQPAQSKPMSRALAHQILGIPLGNVSMQDLKAAYRKGALEWHPDRAKNHASPDVAKERFQKIKEAFDLLKK